MNQKPSATCPRLQLGHATQNGDLTSASSVKPVPFEERAVVQDVVGFAVGTDDAGVENHDAMTKLFRQCEIMRRDDHRLRQRFEQVHCSATASRVETRGRFVKDKDR